MAENARTAFEFPQEMRAFVEKGVEEARRSFETFMSAAQSAVGKMEGQAANTREGAKELGELSMKFAQKNIQSSFEFTQSLLRARDVEEVMKLQADYLRSQMQTLSEQAKELGSQASKMTGGSSAKN